MEWLPNLIDALGRLWTNTGLTGLVSLGGFLFLSVVLVIAYRHSSAILSAVNAFLDHKAADIESRTETNAQLAQQTELLKLLPALKTSIEALPSQFAGACRAGQVVIVDNTKTNVPEPEVKISPILQG